MKLRAYAEFMQFQNGIQWKTYHNHLKEENDEEQKQKKKKLPTSAQKLEERFSVFALEAADCVSVVSVCARARPTTESMQCALPQCAHHI